MTTMLNVKSLKDTHNMLIEKFRDCLIQTVDVKIDQALGRVVAKDIYCPEDQPPFSRSTVDGYAVRAEDTFGASMFLPAMVDIVGEVKMGKQVDLIINRSQACSIPTGGMLPVGSDSVVMVEYTEKLDNNTVLIEKPVSPGENVILKGEDVRKGEMLFSKGHVLRPQDIGVLASAGIHEVSVYERFKVAIISTGDEVVDPFKQVTAGKIRDINSYSLSAAVLKDGFCPIPLGIVKDSFDSLRNVLKKALEAADVVLLSGGSSVGIMDMTYKVIGSLDESEIFIHGVAIKPGKPTIIARVGRKAVFGLPGHPVSAFILYHTVVSSFLNLIIGKSDASNMREAYFSENYASAPGRDEFVMVNISEENGRMLACPVHGKSGMIATMSRADGYVHIPASSEGIYKDEKVCVHLF